MSDVTSHNSDDELHEAIDDVKDLLVDFKHQQQQLDEERWILIEQTQGHLAMFENHTSDYEMKRDQLDLRQEDLTTHRKTFEKALADLNMQLDAKQEAKQDRSTGESTSGDIPPPAKPGAIADSGEPPKIVTKEQIKKLKSQLNKPKIELTYSPPGGMSQTSALDKDLKTMAKIHEKQGRLTEHSIRMRMNWNESKGPKP